jgi:hypothetical protein
MSGKSPPAEGSEIQELRWLEFILSRGERVAVTARNGFLSARPRLQSGNKIGLL